MMSVELMHFLEVLAGAVTACSAMYGLERLRVRRIKNGNGRPTRYGDAHIDHQFKVTRDEFQLALKEERLSIKEEIQELKEDMREDLRETRRVIDEGFREASGQ